MKLTTSRQLLAALPLVCSLFISLSAVAKTDIKTTNKVTPKVTAHENVSYNYAGVQFIDQNLDDYNCDQNGLGIHGSLEFHEDFFALGSYTDVSSNNCGSETISLGAGYHTAFNERASIYGALSFEDTSVDYGRSDSGLILAVGLRGFIRPKLEAKAELAHHTTFDGNTLLSAGMAYWFNPKFAATADVGVGSESSNISLGLRVSF